MQLIEVWRVITEEPQQRRCGVQTNQQIEDTLPVRSLIEDRFADFGSEAGEWEAHREGDGIYSKSESERNQLADDVDNRDSTSGTNANQHKCTDKLINI